MAKTITQKQNLIESSVQFELPIFYKRDSDYLVIGECDELGGYFCMDLTTGQVEATAETLEELLLSERLGYKSKNVEIPKNVHISYNNIVEYEKGDKIQTGHKYRR